MVSIDMWIKRAGLLCIAAWLAAGSDLALPLWEITGTRKHVVLLGTTGAALVDYLFSGEWWITIFPGLMLIVIALSVNLLGDWLRDALNPKLR